MRPVMFIKSNIRKVTIAMEKTLGNRAYIRLGQAGIIHLARTESDEVPERNGNPCRGNKTRDIIVAGGASYALNALRIEAGETFVLVKMRDLEGDARYVSNAKKIIERYTACSHPNTG